MSITCINRQSDNFKGTGLPFYRNLEHLDIYQTIEGSGIMGMWMTPVGKLPTFQLWLLDPVDTFEVIHFRTGASYTIDPLLLEGDIVTQNLNTFYVYSLVDGDVSALDCGLYYFKIVDDASREYYSELFELKNPSANDFPTFESAAYDGTTQPTACAGAGIVIQSSISGGTLTGVTHSATVNVINTTNPDDICVTGFAPETVRFYFSVTAANGALLTYTYLLTVGINFATSSYVQQIF